MTSTRSDGFNTLLYLFVPIQLMSVYGTLSERMELILLFLFNLVAIVAHLHYAICVVGANGPRPIDLLLFFLSRFDRSAIIWASSPSRSPLVLDHRQKFM